MLFPPDKVAQPPARVVITGAGIVTALGIGWAANATGFRSGQTSFRPVTLFDTSRHRTKKAAEVELPTEPPLTRLPSRQAKRLDRAGRLLLWAAAEAWAGAGWQGSFRLPIVLGTTSGGMSLGQDYFRQSVDRPGCHRTQATRVVHYQAQRQGLDLANAFGVTGPVLVIGNACASGANALGEAWRILRRGRAERVLAGGYDALSELVFSGFDSLQALSSGQCRPFDARRDGLALGEGAAVFALETLEHARQRHAEILGEIVGYGAATDAHHLTQPHPEGDAAVRSMAQACLSAGLACEQIGYLNAHGTGTVLNDSAEARAIQRWAGTHTPHLPVSSTKSSIGHLLGAAGAVEAAVCLMALQGQWLPPSSTVREVDPAVSFPLVRQPSNASLEHVMTNSFGFGGANATLILRGWS